MNKKNKKFSLTLIEIIIVIVLIGMVGSVIAYNVSGGLHKGKEFKTKQAVQMLKNVLAMEIQNRSELEAFATRTDKADFLKKTGLIKNPDDILTDAWGSPFRFSWSRGEIVIRSDHISANGKVTPP